MTRPRVLQDTHNRIIRDLRISITDRCNFHCVYCLPETEEAANFYRPNTLGPSIGPSKIRPANSNPIYPLKSRSQILTFEEITRVTRVAASLGVNKVRITGGEPLLRRGVENLVSQITSIDSIRDLSLTTNGTGFGGRLTAAPINSREHTLHFGLAAAQESYGNSSNGDNERFRLRTRPAGHLSDASRTALIDLNSGQRTDVTKLGVEAAGVMGPFSLQAEYATADADDASEEGTVSSYYLAGSFVITGERRSYKGKNGVFGGVKPNGQHGAWELVARMDFAEGDQNPLGGATSADVEVDSMTLGVTWYANPNTRVMLSYWDAEITDQLNNTVVDKPSAITGRVQFNF